MTLHKTVVIMHSITSGILLDLYNTMCYMDFFLIIKKMLIPIKEVLKCIITSLATKFNYAYARQNYALKVLYTL